MLDASAGDQRCFCRRLTCSCCSCTRVVGKPAFRAALSCGISTLGATPAVLRRKWSLRGAVGALKCIVRQRDHTLPPPYFSHRRSIPVRPLISHEPSGRLREFSDALSNGAGGHIFRMFNLRMHSGPPCLGNSRGPCVVCREKHVRIWGVFFSVCFVFVFHSQAISASGSSWLWRTRLRSSWLDFADWSALSAARCCGRTRLSPTRLRLAACNSAESRSGRQLGQQNKPFQVVWRSLTNINC